MGKEKEMNLRKKCLMKSLLQTGKSGKSYIQDIVNQLNAEANSHCPRVPSESAPLLEKPMSTTQHVEKKNVAEIPSKRVLEVDDQTLMPRKKKSRPSESTIYTPTRNRPLGDLNVLPQIKTSVSQKCHPITLEVSLLYDETQKILKSAERDVKSFFKKDENAKKCNTKASTSDVLSAIDGDLVFKEITTFRERHEYKKFYNRNILLGQRLKEGIELANEYLSTLKQAITMLPVYPQRMKKLITMFNKVFRWYRVRPVHGHYRTVCRHLVLVKTLLTKFNNKHGLPSNFVPNPKKTIGS